VTGSLELNISVVLSLPAVRRILIIIGSKIKLTRPVPATLLLREC